MRGLDAAEETDDSDGPHEVHQPGRQRRHAEVEQGHAHDGHVQNEAQHLDGHQTRRVRGSNVEKRLLLRYVLEASRVVWMLRTTAYNIP